MDEYRFVFVKKNYIYICAFFLLKHQHYNTTSKNIIINLKHTNTNKLFVHILRWIIFLQQSINKLLLSFRTWFIVPFEEVTYLTHALCIHSNQKTLCLGSLKSMMNKEENQRRTYTWIKASSNLTQMKNWI